MPFGGPRTACPPSRAASGVQPTDERERGVRVEPHVRVQGHVDGDARVRGEDDARPGRVADVGPERAAETPRRRDEERDHALLLPDRQAAGERAPDAVPVPAARVGDVPALAGADDVEHERGARHAGAGARVRPGERRVARRAQHARLSGPRGARGRHEGLGALRSDVPPRTREPRERERLDLVHEDVGGQPQHVPRLVRLRGAGPGGVRQGRVRAHAVRSSWPRVLRGRAASDAAGRAQTSVRWKLCHEREAVGPRWPW